MYDFSLGILKLISTTQGQWSLQKLGSTYNYLSIITLTLFVRTGSINVEEFWVTLEDSEITFSKPSLLQNL